MVAVRVRVGFVANPPCPPSPVDPSPESRAPRRRHNRGGITLSVPIRLSPPIQSRVPAVSLSLTLGAIHGCRVTREEGRGVASFVSPFSVFPHFPFSIQGSAKRWAPGCVNAAGKARQKWQATAATKFTKPGDSLLAVPCGLSSVKSRSRPRKPAMQAPSKESCDATMQLSSNREICQ